MVKKKKGIVYEFSKVILKDKILGKELRKVDNIWKESDVKRIRIIMEYGGI